MQYMNIIAQEKLILLYIFIKKLKQEIVSTLTIKAMSTVQKI